MSVFDPPRTLADLKNLPRERQKLLLLKRLQGIYPRWINRGGLIKELLAQPERIYPEGTIFVKDQPILKPNSPIPQYGYPLAVGSDSNEGKAITEYLLEEPWQALLNDGYLFETKRPGVYKISENVIGDRSNRETHVSPIASELAVMLHPDLAAASRDFRAGQLKDAVRDAFRIYENRLNAIRDVCPDEKVHGKNGVALAHALVKSAEFRFPFPNLAPKNQSALTGYKEGLGQLFAGALGLIRNSYDHEAHNLPELEEHSALELLFFASYLLRLLDSSNGQ